jgi:hypothetical protein
MANNSDYLWLVISTKSFMLKVSQNRPDTVVEFKIAYKIKNEFLILLGFNQIKFRLNEFDNSIRPFLKHYH